MARVSTVSIGPFAGQNNGHFLHGVSGSSLLSPCSTTQGEKLKRFRGRFIFRLRGLRPRPSAHWTRRAAAHQGGECKEERQQVGGIISQFAVLLGRLAAQTVKQFVSQFLSPEFNPMVLRCCFLAPFPGLCPNSGRRIWRAPSRGGNRTQRRPFLHSYVSCMSIRTYFRQGPAGVALSL